MACSRRGRSRYGLGIASPEPARHSPPGTVLWLVGLGAVTVAALAIAVRWHSEIDLDQQQGLLTALTQGDLRHAFSGPTQTSGPGFGLVMLAPYAALRTVIDPSDAYLSVSFLALVLLVPATVAASRSVGVEARSARELANVAIVVLSVPVLGSYWEAFHPADVLAVAVCLAAFVAFTRGHLGWTCVLLGLAVATRQWAVVAVLVLAVASDGRDRAVLALGSGAVAAVLLAPFFLANPELTSRTLAAKTVWRYPFTAPGLLPLGPAARFAVARYAPLALVTLLCLWLYRRHGRGQPDAVVAALAAGLMMRPLVDPAGFAYYLVAAFPFVVLMRPTSWRWPVIGAGFGAAVWIRRLLLARFPAFDGLDPTGWVPPDLGPMRPAGATLSILVTALAIGVLVGALSELRRVTAPGEGTS